MFVTTRSAAQKYFRSMPLLNMHVSRQRYASIASELPTSPLDEQLFFFPLQSQPTRQSNVTDGGASRLTYRGWYLRDLVNIIAGDRQWISYPRISHFGHAGKWVARRNKIQLVIGTTCHSFDFQKKLSGRLSLMLELKLLLASNGVDLLKAYVCHRII